MHTKGAYPDFSEMQGRFPALAAVYFEFNRLKQLYRQGWLQQGLSRERCESVAEHSFGVALLSMLFAQTRPSGIDALKTIKMALLHDFGEIYTGDFTPQDAFPLDEKHELEYQSVLSVFRHWPDGADLIAIWEEFERGETGEARLVRQADRLEMAFQALIYDRQNLVDPASFLSSASRALEDPELQLILRNTISQYNQMRG